MKLIKDKYFVLFFLFLWSEFYGASKLILRLRIFPSDYKLFVDGSQVQILEADREDNIKKIKLTKGEHRIKIVSNGYVEKEININLSKNLLIEDKLEKINSKLNLLSVVKTGNQPKSVRFTPDGKFLLVPLLDDNGIDIIDVKKGHVIKRVVPESFGDKKGFVETAVLKRKNEFWVSQMTTGYIHIVDLKSFEVKKSIKTMGKFPKVIIFDREETKGFISNWITKDITVIDTENYNIIKILKTYGTPRGMVLSPDERYLYVALYDKDEIVKIRIEDGEIVNRIKCSTSMRHLVADYDKRVFFASSLGNGKIFKISFDSDKILKENFIASKLNTIVLSDDKKFLYVSSRGRNGKKGYLFKGPEFGKVFVVDSESLNILDWVWGKNQPTGLDTYNKVFAFSDFLDGEVEIYSNGY